MWDLESFLDTAITSMIPLLIFISGSIMACLGAFRVMQHLMGEPHISWLGTIIYVMVGSGAAVGGIWLLNNTEPFPDTDPEASPSASPTQTPTQAPSVPPAEPATPVDLTWLWITLGIAAVLTVLIVGTLVTVMLVKRLRRASAADAERQRIEQARKERLERAWQSWLDRHQVIKDRVLEAETDWDLIFHYPSLSDPTIPQTRDLHRALRAADTADQSMPADLDERTQIDQLTYPKLVLQVEEAWQLAYSFAKRTGQKLLPRQERKTIEQIIKLLNIAKNAGGSSSERDVAYARAQKLIQSLRVVKVPERAMLAIEQEQRLMLEASAQPQQAAMSAPEDTSKTPIVL